MLQAEPASDFDFDGSASAVPVGISEMLLPGVPYLPLNPVHPQLTDLGCGSGPDVVVDGRTMRTSVTASPRELLDGDPVPARLCGTQDRVLCAAGETTVTVAAPPTRSSRSGWCSALPDAVMHVAAPTTADPMTRSVDEVSTDYVAMRENANPGWEAVAGGAELEAQVFDGWRQGWRTAGHGAVTRTLRPGRARTARVWSRVS